jgi:hypothetical protein
MLPEPLHCKDDIQSVGFLRIFFYVSNYFLSSFLVSVWLAKTGIAQTCISSARIKENGNCSRGRMESSMYDDTLVYATILTYIMGMLLCFSFIFWFMGLNLSFHSHLYWTNGSDPSSPLCSNHFHCWTMSMTYEIKLTRGYVKKWFLRQGSVLYDLWKINI